MRLRAFELSEEHKNILLTQKKNILLSIDRICTYLVENGNVSAAWKNELLQENMINYFEVLPKAGRLRVRTIELELLVPELTGEKKTRLYTKDSTQENLAVIAKVKRILLDRKSKLMSMINQTNDEDQLSLINSHLKQTQKFLDDCDLWKISTQLLLAEIGALHHAENIATALAETIVNQDNIDYLKFIHLINEIKAVIKKHGLTNTAKRIVKHSSRTDITKTRQQFNTLYNDINTLYTSLSRANLLKQFDEKLSNHFFEDQFKAMQFMFFTKNDINYANR